MSIKNYFKYFAILLVVNSCANRKLPDISIFNLYESGFRNSNITISGENNFLEKKLAEKSTIPSTESKAKVWFPKLSYIKKYSDELILYIDTIELELKQSANLNVTNGIEKYREDDMESVYKMFQQGTRAEDLKRKIVAYKEKMLNVDQAMTSILNDEIETLFYYINNKALTNESFGKKYFKNLPTIGAVAILQQIENTVRVTENKLMRYCCNQVPPKEKF